MELCVFQIKLNGGKCFSISRYPNNYKRKSYQHIYFKSCGTQLEHNN